MDKSAVIIDDNILNLESMVALLRREGVSAVTMQTPEGLAETLVELEGLAVNFLDIEFPNHDGFEILSWLKTMDAVRDIPIVAYTVHTSQQNEAREAGFHSFLGKPLSVERFPDQLRRIMAGQPV